MEALAKNHTDKEQFDAPFDVLTETLDYLNLRGGDTQKKDRDE